jgi:D-arabinose 1-dehydrogenase-like Zn-dependent alcohol dehydrogenase
MCWHAQRTLLHFQPLMEILSFRKFLTLQNRDPKLRVPRASPFFFQGYNLKSSLVASRLVHDNMLKFAAHHHVVPTIEKFELSEKGFAEALESMNSGKLRYRGVLVAAK